MAGTPDLKKSELISFMYFCYFQCVCIDAVHFWLKTVVILADSHSAQHFSTAGLA